MKVKRIPRDVVKAIKKLEEKRIGINSVRYYAYYNCPNGELVKTTVAVKTHPKNTDELMMKPVAIHFMNGKHYARDIGFTYIGGYQVEWSDEVEGRESDTPWVSAKDYFDFNPQATTVCLERFEGSEYRYSGYRECAKADVDLMKYLQLWREHPKVELLMKAGMTKLAMSKMFIKACERDKGLTSYARSKADFIRYEGNSLNVPMFLMAYREGITYEDVKLLNEAERLRREQIKREEYEKRIAEMKRESTYIESQGASRAEYEDYITACKYLGLDMSDTKNKFPRDFKYWHDVRADEYRTAKALDDERIRKELYENFGKVASKYLGLQYDKKNDFLVFIAKSPDDLKREGERLHHCVGKMGYDQKFAREETLIFFIRAKESPDEPFVTVEYSPKTKQILQYHGVNNSVPAKNVHDFIYDNWLVYANRKIKKITA